MAKVTRTPRKGNWDIITKGDVALCFGDSGGPAFRFEDDRRYMISVNSRGNIRDISYLSKTLANAVFSSWIRKLADGLEIKVCGIHKDAPSCSVDITQPAPPEPKEPPKKKAPGEGAPWWLWVLILGGSAVGAWLLSLVKKPSKK